MSEHTEERRKSSIEFMFVELGKLQETARNTHEIVQNLDVKVGIQNGRVGKLENWKSFVLGMGCILTLLVIPMAVKMFPIILQSLIK